MYQDSRPDGIESQKNVGMSPNRNEQATITNTPATATVCQCVQIKEDSLTYWRSDSINNK